MQDYFIRYAGSFDWWRWPQNGEMKVYNYRGGWHEINENSPAWMSATVLRDVKDWHDLFLQTGYCFLSRGQQLSSDMWIEPNGTFYVCEDGGHELAAEDIFDIVYGEDAEDVYCVGDTLIKRGWIKVTTSHFMLEQYCLCGMYDNLRYTAQKETLRMWANIFNMEEELKFYGIL